jgi:ketosteroid isomerase-like protein
MAPRIIVAFVLVAILALTGCQKQAPAPLTAAEQAAIRAEVTAAAKTLLAAGEALDLEAVERLSHDGPDFFYVMPDGAVLNLAEVMKFGGEMLATLSDQVFITQKEHLIVLDRDTALYVWQGRNDLVQKDGVVMTADPYGATYLFRKIGGAWKFAYAHESALPFQPVKPEGASAQE